MSFDMYLDGTITFLNRTDADLKKKPISEVYRLASWGKHLDLNGYITKSFGDGEDDCGPIGLSIDNMLQIMKAVENDELPSMTNPGCGDSAYNATHKRRDIHIFTNAIEWLRLARKNERRSVSYEVSC